MAGTEYTYTIKFMGGQALAQATDFKRQLEERLGTLSFKTKLDLGAMETSLKGVSERAAAATGRVTTAAMQRTIEGVQRLALRSGAEQFIKPLESSFAAMLANPTKEGVAKMNELDAAMRRAQVATQKLGFTMDEYMGATAWEKRFGAIQAAQRRLWGVRGLGFQIASYGRQMMVAGGALVGSLAATAKAYLDYAEPMNRAARNLDLNIRLTNELDDALREMSGTVSYMTPKVQAEVLYLWAAATGEVIDNQQELNDVLTRSLSIQKLMILGAVDQQTAVEAVTDVISQYGMNVADTEKVVDLFITVAANSKAEVNDLAMAFSYAGTRAVAANTSLEETAAIFELLSAAGLRGSRAGRGVSRLIENLIAPSNVAKKVLDELFMDTFGEGVEVMINAEGEFVGLTKAISLLAEATEGLTDAERAEAIAKATTENAARALIPLLNQEIESRRRGFSILEEFTAKEAGMASEHRDLAIQMMEDIYGYTMNTRSATETASAYWLQYTNSITGQADKIKAQWASVVATIGKTLAPGFAKDLEHVADLMGKIAAAIQKTPLLAETAKWAGYLAVAGGLIAMVGGKGLTLTADIKAITMARTMKESADELMAAAISIRQSAIMIATGGEGAAVGGAATAAGGAAAASKWGLVGAALSKVALTLAVGYAGGAVVGEKTIGRSPYEMFHYADNERAGRELAENTLAAGMSMEDIIAAIDDTKSQMDDLRLWAAKSNLLFGKTFGGVGWEVIPEKYKPGLGTPSSTLMREDYKALEAALKIYEEALSGIAEMQGLELPFTPAGMAAQAAVPQAPYGFTEEGLARYTYGVEVAEGQQALLNRQMIVGRLRVEELAQALGLSEEATTDWAEALYDGNLNFGATMSLLEMSIKIMDKLGGELSQLDVAVAGGQAAAAAWDMFAGMRGVYSFDEAAEGYRQYLDGLNQMLSQSQATTATELAWEIAAYNQSWQEKLDGAQEYYDQVEAMQTGAAGIADEFVLGLAGAMPYEEALAAARKFQSEQEMILVKYKLAADAAGEPIDFTAVNFALRENAIIWDNWQSSVTQSVEDVLGSLRESALSSGWAMFEGMAPIMNTPGGPTELDILRGWVDYKIELNALIDRIEGQSPERQKLYIAQFVANAQAETDAYKSAIEDRKRADEDWIKNRQNLLEQAQKSFRNLVEQQLQPTEVSLEDIMATSAGNYADKWDEAARRIRAAMAGSQQWAFLIPDSVKAGGEKAINAWGQSWLDSFYAGMMPDEVNWDAFVAQFVANLQRQAGKTRLVDRAIEELAARGITATRKDVMAAMGIESPFQQYFFGGLSEGDATKALEDTTRSIVGGVQVTPEDVATAGTSWAGSMISAMDAQLSTQDMVSPLVTAWHTQIQDKGGALSGVGERIADQLWIGIETQIEKKSLVTTIVGAVLAELADVIGGE